MSTNTLTLSSAVKTGPDKTITSLVLNNIRRFEFDPRTGVLLVEDGEGKISTYESFAAVVATVTDDVWTILGQS